MSNLIIGVLLVLVCLQAFYLYRANKKVKQYKMNIIHKTDQLNRFHDIYHLHQDFGWITEAFFVYVMKGGNIKHLRDDLRFDFQNIKENIINEYLGKKAPSAVDPKHLN